MITHPLIAQIDLGTINGIGPLGQVDADPTTPFTMFSLVISNFIGLLTIIASLWFLFQLINGGYLWISAGGDKQAVQNAQKKIFNALIGLLVVIIAYGLAGVVGMFLGFDILNPGNLLYQLAPQIPSLPGLDV